jgi:hypothetical protein
MSTQSITVEELTQYWKTVDELKEGERCESVPLFRLPAWSDICSELDWALHRATRRPFSKRYHGYRGVYRLVALASESDPMKPAVLNRVCGQDSTGTLYIGRSGRLNDRLNLLRLSLQKRVRFTRHGAIDMLNRVPLMKLTFPPNRLAIALLSTGRSTRIVESSLIEAYMNSFGDTPPLNYEL